MNTTTTPKTCACGNLLQYHSVGADYGAACRHCGEPLGMHLAKYTRPGTPEARVSIQYHWCPDPAYFIAAEARRRARP